MLPPQEGPRWARAEVPLETAVLGMSRLPSRQTPDPAAALPALGPEASLHGVERAPRKARCFSELREAAALQREGPLARESLGSHRLFPGEGGSGPGRLPPPDSSAGKAPGSSEPRRLWRAGPLFPPPTPQLGAKKHLSCPAALPVCHFLCSSSPLCQATSAPGQAPCPAGPASFPPRVTIRAAAWNPGASLPSRVSSSSACFPKIIVWGSATTTVAASREALCVITGLRLSLPRVAGCQLEEPAWGWRAHASPKHGSRTVQSRLLDGPSPCHFPRQLVQEPPHHHRAAEAQEWLLCCPPPHGQCPSHRGRVESLWIGASLPNGEAQWRYKS